MLPKIPGRNGPIRTKLVGVTFEGRQELLQICKQQNVSILRLEPETNNKYDPDAIAVYAELKDDKEKLRPVNIGHIANSDRLCEICENVMDGTLFSRSKKIKCPDSTCGYVQEAGLKTDSITCERCNKEIVTQGNRTMLCNVCGDSSWIRNGLASRLRRAMEKGHRYFCRVVDYTGGEDGKSMGCNVEIELIAGSGPV